MQLLTRIPTRQYFISIFIIVTALFITFSSLIYKHYNEAQELNDWTLYNYEVIRQSRKILMDLVDMETGVRGYLLTGRKDFLAPYEEAKKTLAAQIKYLWEYTENDAATQNKIKTWLKEIETYFDGLNTQVDIMRKKGRAGFSQSILDEQKTQMDELREILEGSIKDRIGDLRKQIFLVQEKQRNFKYILFVGTVLAIGGMLLVTLIILALLRRNDDAMKEVREIEERFLTVMNGVNDGLYDFNVEEKSIYYSPAYKAMLGYADDEHPNTIETFRSLLHPDDIEQTFETSRKYRDGNTDVYRNVFRLRHKDGHWVWILSRGIGLRDATGKMVRLIGTHTDISEQKRHEEALKQLNQEMETFTYITSHDLRAPLVNLRGFASEMQRSITKVMPIIKSAEAALPEVDREQLRIAFDEDIPESLSFIVKSVEKMDSLTTAVLDLSRIGSHQYRSEEVDVNAVVKRCVDTLAYEISQKHIKVEVGDLPSIVSDALALEQIFSNILDNAIKYLDPERTGEIMINGERMGNDVIFTIQDNGRGIAEADKIKVFQIFRRARNTLDVRGLGMGMTFVQATLRRLGGTIWFQSTQGVGTTFYFSLPLKLKK